MSKEQIIQKAGWFVGILVIMAVVAVFAAVRDESPNAGPVSTPRPGNRASLENIVNARKTWDVAFEAWSGQSAPDFTVYHLNGQAHKLSDYQGKNLLVVFWATWCPACVSEIPHLIDLRKMYDEEELAILAISNESPAVLKDFAAEKGINYTIATPGDSALPAPFSNVTSIPTTFFINRDGTIKLTALGLVSMEESRAMLEAESGS